MARRYARGFLALPIARVLSPTIHSAGPLASPPSRPRFPPRPHFSTCLSPAAVFDDDDFDDDLLDDDFDDDSLDDELDEDAFDDDDLDFDDLEDDEDFDDLDEDF